MRRASELIICFNIKSAGCDLVRRHEGKQSRRAYKQASRGPRSPVLVYFFLPLLRTSQTIGLTIVVEIEFLRIKTKLIVSHGIIFFFSYGFTIYANLSIILYYIHDVIDDVFRDSTGAFDSSRIKYDVSIPRRVNNFLTLRKSNTILTCSQLVSQLVSQLASQLARSGTCRKKRFQFFFSFESIIIPMTYCTRCNMSRDSNAFETYVHRRVINCFNAWNAAF